MQVWDYSGEVFNLAGQICARYSVLWFFLSAPLMALADHLIVRNTRTVRRLPTCKQEKIGI